MRAGNLRNYSIIGIIAIVVLGAIGIIAAAQDQWVLALAFTYGGLVVTVILILLSVRYLARRAKTDDRKARTCLQRLTALLEDTAHKENAFHTSLSQAQQRLQETVTDQAGSAQRALTSVQDVLTAVQSEVKTLDNNTTAVHSELTKIGRASRASNRHVTTTVRDSTRQIESLAQIYARFTDTKLPMPSTGGFAIDAQALAHLIAVLEQRQPRRILELGSGTSTIWLGYLARTYGGSVISLDHLEHYLAATQTAVDRHQLNEHIECRLAPLQEISCHDASYNWYALEALEDLTDIDMLVVDGPPAATGPKARYPSVPMLIEKLAPHATIVLDDAHREDEMEIVEDWKKSFPELHSIEEGTSRLAVLERKL